ncbi:DUF6049 family protein [Leucobacter luti]|uniref:Uncharacterized protein n=1 Tax=Leucobacter luti TaxID=340320 RepID=A0A4Q7U0U0_9MICO|nr:DUF6049 family protein [Leucobacter luti]MBL3699455.1 hypothetical protein [Leucobacter luti]RZT66965.1 hypothetical protein EV139_1092 [Leucobacter luti]
MALAPRSRGLLAALLVLGMAAGGLSAAAAPATALPAATAATARPVATLTVAPRDPVLRADTAEVEVDVVVSNSGSSELPGGTLELRFGTAPVSDAEGLQGELASGDPIVAESAIGAIPAGDERTVTLTVARSQIPLADTALFGVHLLQAALQQDTGADGDGDAADAAATPDGGAAGAGSALELDTAHSLTATVPVVWHSPAPASADPVVPEGTTPEPTPAADGTPDSGAAVPPDSESPSAAPVPTVQLGAIIPLVLPTDIHTLPTRRELEDLTPGWDRLLTAARTTQATLAIDPRIISGIRAYGSAAPENSLRLLARMETLALPTFLLQFADADPAAQAALGYTKLLAPTSFDFVSRFGTFPAAAEPGTDGDSPTADAVGADADADAATTEAPAAPDAGADSTGDSADAGDSADTGDGPAEPVSLPTLSELLAWPDALSAAWPAEGAVDQATLDLLEASGITTVVLDSANVADATAPRAELGSGSALITDSALGAAARAAIGGTRDADRAAGLARFAALTALAAEGGSGGLLLGLDRGTVADAAEPDAFIDQIAAFDWVTAAPVAELPAGSATLRAGDTLEDRRELLRSAASRETSVNELGAVLVHPEYLSGYQRTRLLELFATRFAAPGVDFTEVAGSYRKRDAELLEGVHAISTEHTQLVGISTRVPVQLHNSLPFDANVRVRVDPASAALALTERDFTEIAVPAEANQRILVPVRSRVSSGESGLVVSVSADSGEPTVYTGTLPITIRSSVETIGLWTLGVLAALLLGFGIWRSVRRKRRAADTDTDADTDAQTVPSDETPSQE